MSKGVNDYTAGVSQAAEGANQLNAKSQDLVNGVKTLTAGVQQVQGVNSSITNGLQKLSEEIAAAGVPTQEELAALTSEAKAFKDQQLPVIQASTKTLKESATASNQTNAASKGIIDQLYSNGKITLEQYKVLAGSLQYSNGINAGLLGKGTEQEPGLLNTTNTLANKVDELSQTSLASAKGIYAIQQALTKVSADPVNDQENVGLIQASKLVDSGLSQVNAGLTDSKKGLLTGVQAYTAGVSSLQEGLSTITGNNTTLTNGASALANGTSTLNSNVPALTQGITALSSGVDQLANGTSTLVSNNSTLLNGANQLASGAGQISDGAGQLAAGSDTLGEGIESAADGVNTLNDSTDKTTDMVATPVETSHKEISKVENNGHAMAPYMMSVGLYVTCLAFALMYPIRHGIKKAENAWKYWASKATVMYTVSTLAAIVMVTALRLINGFEPVNLGLTYLLAILVSAAFMSLVMLLSLTTGFIGDFLLLVFMIVN